MSQTIPTAAAGGKKIHSKFTRMSLEKFAHLQSIAKWRSDKYWAYRLDEWLRSRYVESMQ